MSIAILNRKFILSKYLALSTKGETFVDSGSFLKYRLFFPKIKKDSSVPIVIYLHGAAQRGEDNLKQLDRVMLFLTSGSIQRKHPCYVLAPQCPSGTQWLNTSFKTVPFDHYNQDSIPESIQMKLLINLLSELKKKYPIDENRVYVIGFSMGSSGTWDIITRYPGLFAAAVPISGVSDTSKAGKIVHLPIWAFHGEEDDISPVRLNQEMQSAINSKGGNCKLTTFPGVGHGCVRKALLYPGFQEWLFAQKRLHELQQGDPF